LKDVRSVVEATIVKVRTSPLFARSGLMGGYRGAKLSRGTALIRQSVTANAATALAAIDIAKTDPSPSDLARDRSDVHRDPQRQDRSRDDPTTHENVRLRLAGPWSGHRAAQAQHAALSPHAPEPPALTLQPQASVLEDCQ
jgi:hypothetical protein